MSQHTSTTLDQSAQSYRLPRHVVPQRYEIIIEPNLENASFAGEETVAVEVLSPTAEILLNAVELEISECFVVDSKGTKHPATIELDEAEERLRLKFASPIPKGPAKVSARFAGILNDKLHGFYRSTYKDKDGVERYIATTQFEATDARRAFPCWDEPDFKAVYAVSLKVDELLTAISNASVEIETKLPGGKKLVKFRDTIKMSTYLVAFIVGPFVSTPPIMVNKTPIRIWAWPEKLHLAKFAEGIAAHSLKYFEEYYGVPYAGDKLDFIAIPDFAYGAMENLGAITFRETALLVDENSASHSEQERVADVVAHEIAHMWFGDLTTMCWWNGIWLNEAFATFMEMMAVDSWKPEWKRWESFSVSRSQAMTTDGLKSTRSIEFPVGKPEEAGAMFDILTYEKGASVLRMLEQYIGPEKFKQGIRNYLQKFQYANTETDDLWQSLQGASNVPVSEVMEAWIYGKGYPLVSVETLSKRQYVLKQERFLYTPDAAEQTQFQVPVIIKAKSGNKIVEKRILLKSEGERVEFDADVDWLVANAGGHGFYRVRYDKEALALFKTETLRELDAIERFNLISDAWALTIANRSTLAEYLKFLISYSEERDKNVWSAIITSMQYLYRLVHNDQEENLNAYIAKFVKPILEKIDWPNASKRSESNLDQVRAQLISCLGAFGNDNEVQTRCLKLLAQYDKDKSSVNAELVPTLVYVSAFAGGDAEFVQFAKHYKEAATPQEKDRFLYALARFRGEKQIRKALEMVLNGDVRSQNAPFLLRDLLLNPYARSLAWQFTKEKWTEIHEYFPMQLVVRMLEGVTGMVTTEFQSDVHAFFANRDTSFGKKTLDQHIEKLDTAVALMQREQTTLGRNWV
jgi:puromycin-sensitive aminopeptidase